MEPSDGLYIPTEEEAAATLEEIEAALVNAEEREAAELAAFQRRLAVLCGHTSRAIENLTLIAATARDTKADPLWLRLPLREAMTHLAVIDHELKQMVARVTPGEDTGRE